MSPDTTEILTLDDVVKFFDRHWAMVLGCALAAALLCVLVVGLLLPAKYLASVTLIIVPPAVTSELQAPTLSIHSYKNLLESQAVLVETHGRLVTEGVIREGEILELGRELQAKIFISRQEETTALAPMLEAESRADNAEAAAVIANTWADAFLEQVRAISRRAMLAGVNFVEDQFPKTKSVLAEREEEWEEVSADFQKRLQDARTRGDRRIAALKKRSAQAVAEHKRESRQLIEELLLEGLRELRQQPDTTSQELVSALSQLAGVRAQMAQVRPLLVLEKAITDDALWVSLALDEAQDPDLVGSLLTQEINPVYSDLATNAANIELQVKGQARELLEQVTGAIAELEQVQEERSASLRSLDNDWSVELTILERERQREVDAITRERTVRIDQLRRGIEQTAELEAELARKFSEAILARAQADIDTVYVSAPAVPPLKEEDRGVILKALVAAILGAIIGAALSLIRDVHARR